MYPWIYCIFSPSVHYKLTDDSFKPRSESFRIATFKKSECYFQKLDCYFQDMDPVKYEETIPLRHCLRFHLQRSVWLLHVFFFSIVSPRCFLVCNFEKKTFKGHLVMTRRLRFIFEAFFRFASGQRGIFISCNPKNSHLVLKIVLISCHQTICIYDPLHSALRWGNLRINGWEIIFPF